MILIYKQVKNVWTVVRYGCPHCEKNYKAIQYAEKHIDKCRINTLKQQEKQKLKDLKTMPVQAITRNGKRYYRWGDEGKLYDNRADAERQGRAAYASGYRESTTTRDNRAERAGREVTRDMEYDDTHDRRYESGESATVRDDKAERAGKRVAKDIEYDEKNRRRYRY